MAPDRLNRGELVCAAFALLLLVVTFALAWYGVDGIPGRPGAPNAARSENAWQGLSVLRWLMLVTILTAFAAVVVHLARPGRHVVAAVRLLLLGLTTLTAALLIVRVLIDLPSGDRVVDQKIGAVLGLCAALGMAYGAFEAVREQRSRLRVATASPT
jgi:hypothetical protein